MSEKTGPSEHDARTKQTNLRKGPNLILIYSLLGAALVIAMVIAALIVLPFYHRH